MKKNEQTQSPLGDDEALLRDLLAGERSIDDPAVSARLEVDPEFASAVQDYERLAVKLDKVGSDEREIMRRAFANRTRRWPMLAAAAAAAALLAWVAWPDRETSYHPVGLEQLEGVMLSGSEFELRLEGSGAAPILRWDVEAGVGWFDVSVFEELPDGERMLLQQSECFESELALDPTPWQSSEHPVVIRVEQHVDGIAAPVRQASLSLRSGP